MAAASSLPLFDIDGGIPPAPPTAEALDLAAQLQARWGGRCRLGTSSWHFPGWQGLVWRDAHAESDLSKRGLPAYAQHPLLRTVSLDRAFYRLQTRDDYARVALQVPADFRFVVKAPALLTDATVRETGSGKPQALNPQFLDPTLATAGCIEPALQGLGDQLGVMVFQLSPLPPHWLQGRGRPLLAALDELWPPVMAALQGRALAALEVRDAALLTPELADQLKAHGVRYALGLHSRLPVAADQLPMLRRGWPGDLVCRWNLQRGLRYTQAKQAWEPFDQLQAPDPVSRAELARVARATLDAGRSAFITINNKAEGSAPLSVLALARELVAPAAAPAAAVTAA
ncbi:MAG: DUF72 domain-containing protein [Proteobacteria bacterium]|nr:DUF72 domain-containing protein [Pseudomonadota bacterium]